MSTNLPLGTYVQDGVRSGPYYKGAPSTIVSPTQQYAVYGPGILYSSLNTYSIVPATPPGGFSKLDNIAAAQQVAAAGDLTLLGDNSVTKLITGANGQAYVQLDYPRVITVTIGVDALSVAFNVNIFGTDWYGNQMQQKYIIPQNILVASPTYPKITLGLGTNGSIINPITNAAVPVKAFYTITRIAISGAIQNNRTISVGASDVFGLPYLSNDFGDIAAIGWGTGSDLTGAGVAAYAPATPLTSLGVYVAADQTAPVDPNTGVPNGNYVAGITGDVRGLYGVSSDSNGIKRLRLTQYVYGADAWINQLANTELINNVNNVPNVGVQQTPLNVTNLYGQPQFYSGVPT